MKSPCLTCDVHLSGKNKQFNDECSNCRWRIAYARGIETREHDINVIDLKTIYPPVKPAFKPQPKEFVMEETAQPVTPAPTPQKPVTKMCKSCEQWKPLESFVKAHDCVGGYAHQCKACRFSKAKEREQQQRAGIRPPKQPRPTPPKNVTIGVDLAGGPDQTVIIDFTNYPEIYKGLLDKAREEMRTPAAQILWGLRFSCLPAAAR